MCGIVGGDLFTEAQAREALRLLDHRGRDASCLRRYGTVWLGHNRLAIQDLSAAANQPFEHAGCALAYNGELWKRTLAKHAHLRLRHRGRTHSDTELLLLLYVEMGGRMEKFLPELDGMYAFAIYDGTRKCLHLARDYIGRLPLYVHRAPDGRVAFASEVKALTATLGLPYRQERWNSANPDAIQLVQPGTCLTYDCLTRTTHLTRHHSFADYEAGDAEDLEKRVDGPDLGLEFYSFTLRNLLEEAVDNELVSDVPVCTILSGGVDSSVITALLKKRLPRLEAFVVHVGEEKRKDDLAHARLAAKHIGVPLHEVHLTKAQATLSVTEAVYAVEDKHWNQVAPAVAQIALAKEIGRRGFKVVFGGEGADELFASYSDEKRWRWRDPLVWHNQRVKLTARLHDNNLIRANKAMMWGGTVELRTPFLDRRLVDFALRIPTRYRDDNGGKGGREKHVLREAVKDLLPDELRLRPKVAFQNGCHTDHLKDSQALIEAEFARRFHPRAPRAGLHTTARV